MCLLPRDGEEMHTKVLSNHHSSRHLLHTSLFLFFPQPLAKIAPRPSLDTFDCSYAFWNHEKQAFLPKQRTASRDEFTA